MKVVITGGTGLIGSCLQNKLLSKGHEVVILSRSKRISKKQGLSYAIWNIDKGIIDVDEVCNSDYIIHLAGANIAEKRWSENQKKIIRESRLQTANLLFKTLKENNHNVKGFISASGADCYGLKTTSTIYKEMDDYGNDFLAKVCEEWESAALQFNSIGVKTACLRTGVVFAHEKSALQKMIAPIKMGIGSAIGSGKQTMSYIHLEDLCNMYVYVLENNIGGIYNAIAGNNTNRQVTNLVAKILKKPLFMPNVPAFVLKIMFGEMATILLEGSAKDNSKIKKQGFKFKYPSLDNILKDVL